MTFKDGEQRSAAAAAIIHRIHKPLPWPPDETEPVLTGAERVLWLTAEAIEYGTAGPVLAELDRLDPSNLRAVGELLCAVAEDSGLLPEQPRHAVAAWLDRQAAEHTITTA